LTLAKAKWNSSRTRSPLRLTSRSPLTCSIIRLVSRATPLSLKGRKLHLVSTAAALPVVGALAADGQYEPIERGVSICFSRVRANAHTWSFRNDSFVAITTLRFRSSYLSPETGQAVHNDNFVPVRLDPGRSFGGWGAWGVYSSTRPQIEILEIERIVHRLHRRFREF
jgi:hypothetical protein